MLQSATNTTNTIVEGGVTLTAIAFLQHTLSNMIPYAIVAIPLIILDLTWGMRAARYRQERVTFSKAFRKTMGKMFDYLCWILIAAGLAIAFEKQWIEWCILGAVIFNEITSIIGNYFETKGIELSIPALWKLIFKKGAGHYGVDVSDDELGEIIKPKPERDEKGRFVKKCGPKFPENESIEIQEEIV